MRSVWLVEEGEYSDYKVLAIFSTEDAAKQFTEHRKESSYREWELDTWTEDRTEFIFQFNLAGELVSESEEAYIKDPHEDSNSVYAWGTHESKDVRIRVARNGPRARALKIASERYVRLRAYLDEAEERVSRSGIKTGYGEEQLVVDVAEILAGTQQLPTPPLSGHQEDIMKVLGIQGGVATEERS
jgi:hypothetical protein